MEIRNSELTGIAVFLYYLNQRPPAELGPPLLVAADF